MLGKIKEFLIDEEGQTSTEYILLVVVVAMIVMKFGTKLNEKLSTLTDTVFDKTQGFADQIGSE